MDEQCLNLAQKTNEQDSDGVDVAKSVLQDTIEKEIGFPYEDIAQDCVEGLLRLNEMIERFQKKMYIPVFTNWSFSDIIGTIINYGLQYEPLWQSAINDDVPSGSNIGDLLADNKMIRAY